MFNGIKLTKDNVVVTGNWDFDLINQSVSVLLDIDTGKDDAFSDAWVEYDLKSDSVILSCRYGFKERKYTPTKTESDLIKNLVKEKCLFENDCTLQEYMDKSVREWEMGMIQ